MTKICERCGCGMPDGSLAYEVRIAVTADFDGVLPTPEPGAQVDAEMRELAARLAKQDPSELMGEVYHCEKHLLCPACRERYVANPLNLPLPEGEIP